MVSSTVPRLEDRWPPVCDTESIRKGAQFVASCGNSLPLDGRKRRSAGEVDQCRAAKKVGTRSGRPGSEFPVGDEVRQFGQRWLRRRRASRRRAHRLRSSSPAKARASVRGRAGGRRSACRRRHPCRRSCRAWRCWPCSRGCRRPTWNSRPARLAKRSRRSLVVRRRWPQRAPSRMAARIRAPVLWMCISSSSGWSQFCRADRGRSIAWPPAMPREPAARRAAHGSSSSWRAGAEPWRAGIRRPGLQAVADQQGGRLVELRHGRSVCRDAARRRPCRAVVVDQRITWIISTAQASVSSVPAPRQCSPAAKASSGRTRLPPPSVL